MIETFTTDLKSAMLSKETLRVSVLRSILTAYKNEVVAKSLGPEGRLSTEDTVILLKRMVKQRQDSAEQYHIGGRHEQEDQELAEIQIINHYLPRTLTEEELKVAVQEAIQVSGAVTKKDMGKAMKALKEAHGVNYDGKLASSLVQASLV